VSGTIRADVLVVGAGPAGSSAATTLSRHGLDVVLADKARFPRDKCCGDGLTTGALRRLERLGLDTAAVGSFTPAAAIAVRSPHGRVTELPLVRSGSCCAAVARRRDLDAALVEIARDAGATVLDGHELHRLEVDERSGDAACRAEIGDGVVVRSRFVVAADGAWSRVRSLREGAGVPGTLETRAGAGGWHAFRAYAVRVAPIASQRLWVAFEPELLPGYLWSFPLAGSTANVGIVLRRPRGGSGRALAAAWRDALASPFLTSLLGADAALEGPARSWPIPAGIDRTPVADTSGRVIYVGDAARAADPFTGEGIGQALETGVAAAEAIDAAGMHDPDLAARRYRAELRRSLDAEHRVSRGLSALFASVAGAEAVVALAGASSATRRAAGRWLFEDVPRILPIAPGLWRRETFSAPVPYAVARGSGRPDAGVDRRDDAGTGAPVSPG